MPSRRIKLTMEGLAKDGGHVLLKDFVREVRLLHESLVLVDLALSESRKPRLDFRVVNLSHNSPAMVEIEGYDRSLDQGEAGPQVLAEYMGFVEGVREGRVAPPWAELDHYEKLKGMTSPVQKSMASAVLSVNGKSTPLTKALGAQATAQSSPESSYRSSIKGRLEAITVHQKRNVFYIYPVAGPRRVKCKFGESERQDAINAVGKKVVVSGRFSTLRAAKWPSLVAVERIQTLPEDSSLPRLEELRGISNVELGASSEDFARQMREEWEPTDD